MIILRKLFSSNEEKKTQTRDKAIATGLIGGGFVLNTVGGIKVMYKPSKHATEEEALKLTDKIKTSAKNRGVNFEELPTNIAFITPAAYNPGNDTVGLSKTVKLSPELLAHELGHRHFAKENSKGAGKIAHKVYIGKGRGITSGRNQIQVLAPLSSITAGIGSGINKAKTESKDKRESKLNKALPYATAVVASAPCIISEVAASHKGIKLLKDAGASERAIKTSRKNLAAAALTYAGLGVINAGLGKAAKNISYKKMKKKLDEKKMKEVKAKDK